MSINTNWIVFVTPQGVEWQFKFDHGPEYQDHIMKLVAALHSFGEDVFGEGLGFLRVSPHESTRQNEIITIMFVRLSADLYMIISEPELTAKLLEIHETQDMPDTLRDQTRSILIGSLVMMYSQFWGLDIHAGLQKDVDEIFSYNLARIGVEERAFAQNGECSFSQLTLSELILLHYYIQMSLETNKKFHGINQWAVVAGIDGVPLYLYWNLEYGTACSLAAMVSAIYWFAKHMFDLKPREMAFGTTNFVKVSIFSGDKVFLAAANAGELLFHDLGFQQSLFKMKPSLLEDFIVELRQFMINVFVTTQTQLLRQKPIEEIIDQYRTMLAGQGLPLETLDVDMRKPFMECLTLVRTISNSNLIDYTKLTELLPFRLKVLVLGSSVPIKKIFLESILRAELRYEQYDDTLVEILKTQFVFLNRSINLEFWFIDAKDLSRTEFKILSRSITFNTDHVVVPYSFSESRPFPPLVKYINAITQNTGKSIINTTLLLLELPSAKSAKKRVISSYYQVKSKIKQEHSLLCFPMKNISPESFKFFFETILAQYLFDNYWYGLV